MDQMMKIAKVQTTMDGKAVKLAKDKFEVITNFESEMEVSKKLCRGYFKEYPKRTSYRPTDGNKQGAF